MAKKPVKEVEEPVEEMDEEVEETGAALGDDEEGEFGEDDEEEW